MAKRISVYMWLYLFSLVALVLSQSSESDCPGQDATQWSLEYGAPLLAYRQAFNNLFQAGAQANQKIATSTLATPQSTAVVKTNRDTLISRMFYDLSRQDLELAVPVVEDRYYVMAFYTPYGDNYLNLGSTSDTPAGKYLLTMAPSDETLGTMSTETNDTDYKAVVYAPTTFGFVHYRILVKKPISDDLPVVNDILTGFTSREIPRTGEEAEGPALNEEFWAGLPNSTAETVMELNVRFGPVVPYNTTGHGSPVTTSNFSAAGIADGEYAAPSCVNVSEAWADVQEGIESFESGPGNMLDMGNGWTIQAPEISGLYGDDVLARAYIAATGYLMLTPSEALYPLFAGNLSLAANESYVLRFSGKPPLTELGFWSVTMYSAEGYLVDNPIDRYSLGDRDNLTYPDGSPVYGDSAGNDTATDSPFEILIQAQAPPGRWTSNWLPSPEQPGPFQVLLRWYVPAEGLSNGSYVYPLVTKGGAVTGDADTQPSPSPAIPTASSTPSGGTGSSPSATEGSAVPSASGSSVAMPSATNPLTVIGGSIYQYVFVVVLGSFLLPFF